MDSDILFDVGRDYKLLPRSEPMHTNLSRVNGKARSLMQVRDRAGWSF
jgi:hypothetical protein